MYSYECSHCGPFTKIVKIDQRDNVTCKSDHVVKRLIDRPGGVWAPTATGGSMKV
jgi:putative FmdB family regulatory protein